MFYAPVDNLLLIMQQSVLGWKRKLKSFENQPFAWGKLSKLLTPGCIQNGIQTKVASDTVCQDFRTLCH